MSPPRREYRRGGIAASSVTIRIRHDAQRGEETAGRHEGTSAEIVREIVSIGWQINRSSGTSRNEKGWKTSLIRSADRCSIASVMYKLLHADRFMSRHISRVHARPRVQGTAFARRLSLYCGLVTPGVANTDQPRGIKREKPRKTERIRQ